MLRGQVMHQVESFARNERQRTAMLLIRSGASHVSAIVTQPSYPTGKTAFQQATPTVGRVTHSRRCMAVIDACNPQVTDSMVLRGPAGLGPPGTQEPDLINKGLDLRPPRC